MSDEERPGEPQEVDPKQAQQFRPRLTVVENIYYQLPGDEPEHYPTTFTRHLESTEQPYTRRINVGPDWTPLDFGWVQDVGLFILENRGLPRMQFIQAPEDQPEPETLTVLVRPRGVTGHFSWRVPVGESARFSPNWPADDTHPIEVACPGGDVRCMLHAIPR